jgi:hypothetical protein
MAQAQKKLGPKSSRRNFQRIEVARPGNEITQNAQLSRFTRINSEPVDVIKSGQNGRTVVKLDTGEYTYRAIPFAIHSDVDLGADTYSKMGGGYIVENSAISKYISEIRLEANGAPMQEWDTEELRTVNDFYDLKFSGGFMGFHFPGEEMYTRQAHRDLFALGTDNLRGLKLTLRQTGLFDPDTMDIVCVPHFVKQRRSATFVTTTETISKTFSGVGKHTIRDLPDSDDIQSIFIKGDGISHIKLEVNGVLMHDCHIGEYKAYLKSVNRDKGALDNQFFIDFMAEGEPTALAAADGGKSRAKDGIKLEITTTQAETPVKFIVSHVGPYKAVR